MIRTLLPALVLVGLSGQAFAGCADDIARLEPRVKDASREAISASTSGKGVAAAREGQGVDASKQGEPKVAEAPPEKSAAAGEGGDRSQQARVALEEARAALKKGDEGACAGAVSRAKAQLDAAP
ncbi:MULTISPECIES: hypothetical protein [Methylobacterium]|uniref:Antifreeze protein n=3 Tax=Pseudomonadota TaxID=1224 RepID=A0ABQ4SZ93_9HYPH|nr:MULTISPECIES: hypothetical protein [Methylobacterium]PIU07170.1 MAG: hypothetical protein COT56_05870 [Methylobacterium sp. CG09_land_8_20_14_0_10_71_15]PIU12662.1 MAG: hypothetical protein COT28_14230 [Methylobacterium sp. CG08_land_8_20_14_0_20_71_15]GJE08535.1 hypothetical protein AOPFMNJM_3875 [Methylobacterium jeotgali]